MLVGKGLEHMAKRKLGGGGRVIGSSPTHATC